MRTLALARRLARAPRCFRARAQEPTRPTARAITSAQVSGFDLDQLSPGLQEEIGKLAGTPLEPAAAARAGRAHRSRAAALRRGRARHAGSRRRRARRLRRRAHARPGHQANINAKYVVEDVEIKGVPDSAITPELRADLQALTGKPLDSDEAERLETTAEGGVPRLRRDRAGRSAASQTGQITLVFDLTRSESARWLRFEPLKSNAIYHSDQGWGAFADIPIGGRDVRVTPIFALDTTDDLIEEYSGFGVRVESAQARHRAARRELRVVDVRSELARRDAGGARPESDASPAPYDDRTTFTPLVKFAIDAAAQRQRRRQHRRAGSARVGPLPPESHDGERRRSGRSATACGTRGHRRRRDTTSRRRFTVRSGIEGARKRLRLHAVPRPGRLRVSSGRAHRCWCRAWPAASTATRRSSSGSRSAIRGRCAAGTSTTSRRPAATGCSTRRSSTAISVLALFLDSGSVWDSGDDERSPRLDRRRLHSRPVLHDGRLPAQHRRAPRRVHDGRPVRRPRHSRSTDRATADPCRHVVARHASRCCCGRRARRAGGHASNRSRATRCACGRRDSRFIKGEPLARLKDGRSVRVDLELAVLPEARRAPA